MPLDLVRLLTDLSMALRELKMMQTSTRFTPDGLNWECIDELIARVEAARSEAATERGSIRSQTKSA